MGLRPTRILKTFRKELLCLVPEQRFILLFCLLVFSATILEHEKQTQI